MNQNPYARFIKALDKEKEDLDKLATVVSTNPLKIKIGDLEIDRDNIVINSHLFITNEKGERVVSLKNGDDVFVERNRQTFIIVCRVVNI